MENEIFSEVYSSELIVLSFSYDFTHWGHFAYSYELFFFSIIFQDRKCIYAMLLLQDFTSTAEVM
jgi:hypothetical protein